MNSTSADDLIREITEAFDNVPKPSRITLKVARGIDDYVPDDELDKLRDAHAESCWQDIPNAELEKYGDVHPFLCPVMT